MNCLQVTLLVTTLLQRSIVSEPNPLFHKGETLGSLLRLLGYLYFGGYYHPIGITLSASIRISPNKRCAKLIEHKARDTFERSYQDRPHY